MGTLITAAAMTVAGALSTTPTVQPSPSPTPIVQQSNPTVYEGNDEDNEEILSQEICDISTQIVMVKMSLERQKKITKASGLIDMTAVHNATARLIDLKEAGNKKGEQYYQLTGKAFKLKTCEE